MASNEFKVGDVVIAMHLNKFNGFDWFNGKRFIVMVESTVFISVTPLDPEIKESWARLCPSGVGNFGAYKFKLDVFMTAARKAAERENKSSLDL